MIETKKSSLAARVVVPAIERVTAALQADPDLWAKSVIVHMLSGGGIDVSAHEHPWDDVHAMAELLDVSAEPVSAFPLQDSDRLSVRFGESRHNGGIELIWYVPVPTAVLALGPSLTALLGE